MRWLSPSPFSFLLPATALLLAACAPSVNLTTTEPVKIDVGMRVDVYTHEVERKQDESAATSPRVNRRNRMSEVQALKNDRVIGEGNDGMLVLRNIPPDPAYAEYAGKIIIEENTDRSAILQSEATTNNKPLDAVVHDFVRRARDSSWPGELIQQDDGSWMER